MPDGEEMFKYHGYSGDCPKPPLSNTLDHTLRTKISEIVWRAYPSETRGLEKATEVADKIISLVTSYVESAQNQSNKVDKEKHE